MTSMLMAPVMDVVKTKKKMLKTGVRKGKKKDDAIAPVACGLVIKAEIE